MLLTYDLEHKIICSLLCITLGISNDTNSNIKPPPTALFTGVVVICNAILEKACRHTKILKEADALCFRKTFQAEFRESVISTLTTGLCATTATTEPLLRDQRSGTAIGSKDNNATAVKKLAALPIAPE